MLHYVVCLHAMLHRHIEPTGVYFVDASALTPEYLALNLSMPPFGTTTGITLVNGQPSNEVRGSWLCPSGGTSRPADLGPLNEKYISNGTLTSGSIVATFWGFQIGPFTSGPPWFPFTLQQCDVTFNGTTATGTITIIHRDYNHAASSIAETRRWTLRATFTATRLQ